MHEIRVGDCRILTRSLPASHFHSIVTSPPYFQLRDYLNPGQVGRENAPSLYIQSLVEIFRELRRVLRPDGTLWLNIGDTYAKGPMPEGVKKKDLIGIPWMLAFALRADGWHLRSDMRLNPLVVSDCLNGLQARLKRFNLLACAGRSLAVPA